MLRTVPLALALVAGVALVLWLMGRNPICTCGYIKLWHGSANDAETSQHLADWYTPSHIIHGFVFFFLFRHLPARLGFALPAGMAFLLALAVEGAWEVAENTPMVIERYRSATVSLGYTGDSIVNALADIGWMALGFLFARLAPWKLTLGLALAMEVVALAVIRDNLILNIIMLVSPVEAIRRWQAGG
jgi:hypothetical protein